MNKHTVPSNYTLILRPILFSWCQFYWLRAHAAAADPALPATPLHSPAAFQKPDQHQFAVQMKRWTDLIDGVGSTGCQSGSERGEQETGEVERDRGHGEASRCGAYNQSCNTSKSTSQSINKKLSTLYIKLEVKGFKPVKTLVQINFSLLLWLKGAPGTAHHSH